MLFENFESEDLPKSIIEDIKKTGYSVVGLHKHGKVYILKLKNENVGIWDPKDFSRFSWVVDNHSSNNNLKEISLKIKF